MFGLAGEEDLNIGYGTFGPVTLPDGSSANLNKIGIHSLLGDGYVAAANFAGADVGAKIAAAIAVLPAAGGIVDARGLTGTLSTGFTVPANVTVLLGAGTYTSSATVTLTLGSAGASGRVSGSGVETKYDYTGSGHAFEISGTGQTSTGVEVSNMVLQGTSSGLSGLHLKAFNGGTFGGLQIYGFSTGAGVLNEGANHVTFFAPDIYNNLYGIRNVGTTVSSTPYAANAVRVYGGTIRNNTGWGILEDGTGSGGGVGPNYNNVYNGVVLEFNGVNASTTTGNVFIQYGYSIKLVDCYLEYGGGIVPTQNVVIGDGTYAPIGVVVRENAFLSSTATTTVSNVNGQSTSVMGNLETGAVTNFLLNGSAARGLTQLRNRAAAATNLFAGSDNGADSWIFETTAYTGTQVNGMATTTTGLGINQIRGLNQDLVIRARSGGTNIVTFDASDGTDRIIISDAGVVTIGGGVTIQSGSGTPEGAITAVVGSLYMRTNGGAGTSLYVKESGSGNTGWRGI